MDKKSAQIIDSNQRIVPKALHVPKRDMCSQSVSLLQNCKMFYNTTCAESVYLLQNSEIFENEIKFRQRLKDIL